MLLNIAAEAQHSGLKTLIFVWSLRDKDFLNNCANATKAQNVNCIY